MSRNNLQCGHEAPVSSRKTLQRFLDSDRRHSLEEVLELPLDLNAMPFEYNPNSPTPLDPYNVRVHGMGYAAVSLEFMLGELTRNTDNLTDAHQEQIEQAEAEIVHQHDHRIQKNAEAMDRWREYASSGMTKHLSREEAEGVMQVRAGISRPAAVLELISRNPSMGGIEIAKATRPFCLGSHIVARTVLKKDLARTPGVSLVNEEDARPYRFAIDQHNMALITKTEIGVATINDQKLEIVTRESGVLYDPQSVQRIPESIYSKIGGSSFALAPLDITSYVRAS